MTKTRQDDPDRFADLSAQWKQALVDIVLKTITGVCTIDRIVLHGSAVTGGWHDDSDIDIAILLGEIRLPCYETTGNCEKALEEFDPRLEIAFIETSRVKREAAFLLGFHSRLLHTGECLYANPKSSLDNKPALGYAAARKAHSERLMAAATGMHLQKCLTATSMEFEHVDVCLLAHMAAAFMLKGWLSMHDIDYRPKSVRWHVDRLLTLAIWIDPSLQRLQSAAAALPSRYFKTLREQDETMFPPERQPGECRQALAAALLICRTLAPELTRETFQRELLWRRRRLANQQDSKAEQT